MRFFITHGTLANCIYVFGSKPTRIMTSPGFKTYWKGLPVIMMHLRLDFLPIEIEKNECIEVEIEKRGDDKVIIRTLRRKVECETIMI